MLWELLLVNLRKMSKEPNFYGIGIGILSEYITFKKRKKMFEKLFDLLNSKESVTITVTKTNEVLTVTILPKLNEDTEKRLKPFAASGQPEELDKELIDKFAETVLSVRKLFMDDSAMLASVADPKAKAKTNTKSKLTAKITETEDDEVKEQIAKDIKQEKAVKEKKLSKSQTVAIEKCNELVRRASLDKDPLMVEYLKKTVVGLLKKENLDSTEQEATLNARIAELEKNKPEVNDLPFETKAETKVEEPVLTPLPEVAKEVVTEAKADAVSVPLTEEEKPVEAAADFDPELF